MRWVGTTCQHYCMILQHPRAFPSELLLVFSIFNQITAQPCLLTAFSTLQTTKPIRHSAVTSASLFFLFSHHCQMGMSPGNRNEFKRSPLVNPRCLWNCLAPLCGSWLAALILLFKLLGYIKTPPPGWHKALDVLVGLGPLILGQLWTIRCLFLREGEEQGSVWLEADSEWQVERKEQTPEHVVRPHHTGRTTGAEMVWGAGWRSSKAHTAERSAERMYF